LFHQFNYNEYIESTCEWQMASKIKEQSEQAQ
jgi:hypothetical protein